MITLNQKFQVLNYKKLASIVTNKHRVSKYLFKVTTENIKTKSRELVLIFNNDFE